MFGITRSKSGCLHGCSLPKALNKPSISPYCTLFLSVWEQTLGSCIIIIIIIIKVQSNCTEPSIQTKNTPVSLLGNSYSCLKKYQSFRNSGCFMVKLFYVVCKTPSLCCSPVWFKPGEPLGSLRFFFHGRGEWSVVISPQWAPLIYLTYSFSLHQMVLPLWNGREEALPCFWGIEKKRGCSNLDCTCSFDFIFFSSVPDLTSLSILLDHAKALL